MSLSKYLQKINMPESDLHELSEALIRNESLDTVKSNLTQEYPASALATALTVFCREYLGSTLLEIAPVIYNELHASIPASERQALDRKLVIKESKVWAALLEDLQLSLAEKNH